MSPRGYRGTVYFIRPIGMAGPIKIGCSCSPDNRRKSLELWSPFPLEIIAEIDGGPKLERRFHAMFRADHKSHEWFHWSARLDGVIAEVRAGTFDIETLPEPMRVTHLNGRDNSYSTPGWRYQRSIESRLLNLRRRGLSNTEIEASGIYRIDLRHGGIESVEAAKAFCEPLIADWQARFPKRSLVA